MPSLKQLIRKWNPIKKYVYYGEFASHEEALIFAKSSQSYGDKSYDNHSISRINFSEKITNGRNAIVPLILALSNLRNKKGAKILDYGGGVNPIFAHLSEREKEKIKCYVIERKELYEKLNNNVPEHLKNNLIYINSLNDLKKIDLIYFGSSIQYIPNYESLLSDLLKLCPEFIIFSESIFTNDGRDYFVIQSNMKRNSFPNHFISEQAIVKELSNYGYQCIYNKPAGGNHSHKTIDKSTYSSRSIIFRRK